MMMMMMMTFRFPDLLFFPLSRSHTKEDQTHTTTLFCRFLLPVQYARLARCWFLLFQARAHVGARQRAAEDDDIASYEVNGGLFVTWSPILKERQGGVLKYLEKAMEPVVENPEIKKIKDGPINVKVPKRRTG